MLASLTVSRCSSPYKNPGATLDDLREAVTTLEDVERIARRVLGGQHPFTRSSEKSVRVSRAKLRAREDAEAVDVSAQERDAAEAAAVSNRGDQAGAAADPNAELKAEIAALEAQRAALRARETPQARSIRLHMRLLDHASACRAADCPSANCGKMKDLLRHGATCTTRVQGGCAICRRIWALLQIHARQCTRGSCPVPKCASLKAQLAQMQQQGAETAS